MDGIIILDKEKDMFSRTAGYRVAKIFNTKKFGHIGTLDPMATGVLPIIIGNTTKMIPFIEEFCPNKKEYLFGIKFGIETDSLDISGKIVKKAGKIPNEEDIISACNKLVKTTEQIPPVFSAVHINGKRAYELGRRGENIELPARKINLYELKYIGNSRDEFNFKIVCSRGTYVRAIVRDIAKFCDTIGTTTYIRRTKTNGFDIKNAVKLDFLENLVNNGKAVEEYLMASDFALGDIPVINLDTEDVKLYKNGGFIKTGEVGGLRRVYSGKEFIGIGCVKNGLLCPKRTM
ncbi:MAG: tRNA pseudouridine(55) synthase TruB [Alphaproteobacteria bacterium]|nr:tRNA pseudouridine(55) synthase TruB [Alphaproteobacteria bacterium]